MQPSFYSVYKLLPISVRFPVFFYLLQGNELMALLGALAKLVSSEFTLLIECYKTDLSFL